jgi:ABC-type antimicrobial peptide transport system permease subunit
MKLRTLVLRSLRFHWRNHLGVLLGAAVGSAALIGALIVGDSVHGSLRELALQRLGPIRYAMQTGDRLFQGSLSSRLDSIVPRAARSIQISTTAPAYIFPVTGPAAALLLPVVVARQDGTARANQANVIGVDKHNWEALAGWKRPFPSGWDAGRAAMLNETLARQLRVQVGDDIIVRSQKPTALGHEAVISPQSDAVTSLRLKVGQILSAEELGDFSLSASQISPGNLFLPIDVISTQLGVPGRANLLLHGPLSVKPQFTRQDVRLMEWRIRLEIWTRRGIPCRLQAFSEPTPSDALPWLADQVRHVWQLEDAELNVRAVEQPQTATGGEYIQPFVELNTSRIFLEPAVIESAVTPRTRLLADHLAIANDSSDDLAAARFVTNATRVLTYLVNLIRAGDRATPYSMVTATDGRLVPTDLRDDEIVINEWLAEDLSVKPGDSIELTHYVVDSATRLTERTNAFRVRSVVPLRGIWADRTLMPEFPGLAKAESTHDWDAGFPLVHKIRDRDEEYWRKFRGTPKAFINLHAGQKMWANRFGELTAMRYYVPTNSFAATIRDVVYRNVLANLDPASLGLRFEPVREEALRASSQAQDFGELFLGFSFFLILAALILMALLFQFGLEQRTTEIGTLLALGFPPKRVRRLLLAEGTLVAFVGGIVGVLGGIAYAKLMLRGLTTVWHGAVGTSALQFHVTPATLMIGLGASVVVCAITVWFALRKEARRPARELLSEGAEAEVQNSKPKIQNSKRTSWLAAVCGVVALGLIVWALWNRESVSPATFFGAGSLLLVAGLAAVAVLLTTLDRAEASRRLTLTAMGVRACTRRRRRSLASVALLACGSFMIVAVGANRLDAERDAAKRSSGTGGFALFAQSTLPVVRDLNTKTGQEFYNVDPNALRDVRFVPFRVHDGDDASCLNLNRAQTPRLLGVKPELLADRKAFTFAKVLKGLRRDNPWSLLHENRSADSHVRSDQEDRGLGGPRSEADAVIPAIGDAASIQWALGKKIGDTLTYTDEHGRSFKVKLVGAVANSILQGSLIIDEAEFVKRFPGESGYRMFLIDIPSNTPRDLEKVSAELTRALQDVGFEVTPAAERLAAFNAVQNTYLNTFQVLGGLGLLLGSAGLGAVVLRNVLERRGELALLQAVGFRRRALRWLVLSEHGGLLALGLAVGMLAALVAILPVLLSPGANVHALALGATLAGVLVSGLIWTWAATTVSLRGNLLNALRNE